MANASLAGLLRSTIATVLTLLVGAGLVALMVGLVATEVPDGNRDLDAYKAAPRCPSAPAEPAECRWTQEFTVSDIRLTYKRGKLDRATLTDANGAKWETAYTTTGPVLDDMDKGDRLTGTIWRGRVTEVAMNGDSQDTEAAPDDLRARILIGALIVIPPGLLIMAVCVWRLGDKWTHRRVPHDPTHGMTATLGLAMTIFFGGLVCPLLVSSAGENLWPVAAVWLPMTAIMTIATRIYVVIKRARSTTPKQPAFQ
ncbi:hypothetical protein [Actinomadura sp. BRA 177]|uniref:hypothetical protein n=1 Tax=Actinomadura sp. BRA 177 TaxID=2745202 RepID=UPI001595D69C|nr:hypothetical protein [Actinomadura sp. BRA 177]NVI89735.1 hypothetical protein [Actinomadura sp. BRA 177]